jgi:hypothetical protein
MLEGRRGRIGRGAHVNGHATLDKHLESVRQVAHDGHH